MPVARPRTLGSSIVSLGRGAYRLAALGAPFLVASNTLGADLPIIKVTEAGPERDLPIDSAYYLSGDVDSSVSSVQPVFVRLGTKTLFGSTGGSCGEFAARVGKFKAEEGTGGAGAADLPSGQTIRTLRPGIATADKIWVGDGDDFDKGAEVFVTGLWRPPASGGTTFSILVPKSDFFTAVGTYCLFVYRTTTKVGDKSAALRKALDDFAAAAVNCEGKANESQCFAAAQKTRENALAMIGVTGEALKNLTDASNRAINVRVSMQRSMRRLPPLLATWSRVEPGNQAYPPRSPDPIDGFTKAKFALDDWRDVATDPFAKAIVSLLVQHLAIARLVEPGKPPRFVTLDTAQIEIARVQVASSGEQVRVAPSSTAARVVPLPVTTKDLKFAGLDISLRDLIEMLRGRVRFGEAYRSISDISRELRPLFENPKDFAEQHALLTELRARTKLLSALVKQSLQAKADARQEVKDAQLGTEIATYRELGTWLDRFVLTPCDPMVMEAWGRGTVCPPPEAPNAWPGYDVSGSNPLDFVLGEIDAYLVAVGSWPTSDKNLKVEVSTARTPPASPILMKAEFSQDNWVFSYVTPVIGFTVLTSPRETFSLPYIGVQVHLVANPIDEPLWSRRRFTDDLLRAFALELGVVPGNGPWGPDDRFAGWKDIPPFLLAASFHPLPYTSVSYGLAFMEKRSSALAQEKSVFYVSHEFSLSVQANIPDLIAGLRGRTSTTEK